MPARKPSPEKKRKTLRHRTTPSRGADKARDPGRMSADPAGTPAKGRPASAAKNRPVRVNNSGRKNAIPFTRNKDKDHPVSKSELFPIVGIGASAGGLEAFTQLFEALPASTGMAFVLIQHMDPSKASMLPEILSRTAKMPVVEIRDGMAVEPDHVYVMPPNTDILLSEGKLSLLPRPGTRSPHMPIDYFLRSLAADRQDKAIGIILSGTASDGSLGIRAVKAEGGISFVQDITSAKYSGMPASAIATGAVDFILPPERIAQELTRIGTHPYVVPTPKAKAREPLAESENDIQRIFALLREAHGVDFTHYKQATTQRRILRRMVLHRIEQMKQYLQFLHEHPEEVSALFQDMLINVTSFFRDAGTYEALKKKIWPKIVKGRESTLPIRIWVPGCSTGEEAYSIAISLIEALGEFSSTVPIQIFATDVNELALDKARAGVYPESIALDVSPDRLQRFFIRADTGYQISKQIREACIFAKQDLLRDPPFSQLDLISCRNVLIYMKPILQKRVLPVFHYALKHTGYLVLGSSETISEFSDLFGAADRKNKIYLKKATLARPLIDFGFPQYEGDRAGHGKRGAEPVWSLENIQKDADALVMAKFSPPGVIVNEHMEILQFRGQTASFLAPSPGAASLNLMRMAREALMSDLRLAIQQARREGGSVRKRGIAHRINGKQTEIAIEVIPIRTPQAKESFFLILFEETPKPQEPDETERARKKGAGPEKRPQEKRLAQEQYVAQLEQEIVSTKEYLQAVIEEHEATNEELRSANEEIQSSNEELQSTNEELETAKEELQSTNEELTTVNEELANRNFELAQSNNDLVNFLSAVSIPIVMVGNDLRIRRFTPQAEKVLNLIPTDAGRPIGDIKPNISSPDLEQKIQEVISSFTTVEEVVKDRDGHWHSVRIRPYKTTDNKIEGAVISLLDIDRYKSAADKLEGAVRFANAVIDTAREPLLVLDSFLRIRTANRAFYTLFKVSPEETQGNFLYTLGNGQWNIPRLREMLEQVLPKNTRIQDFDVEHDFPRVGPKVIRLNARRVEGSDDDPALILLALQNVTERVQQEKERQDVVDMLEHHLDNFPLVTVEWDPVGKVRRWSKQGESRFGWKANEIVGRPIADSRFVYPKDAGKVQGAFHALVSDRGDSKIVFHCRTARRDGKTIDCEWFASVFRDHDGQPISILTMLREVAEVERIKDKANIP